MRFRSEKIFSQNYLSRAQHSERFSHARLFKMRPRYLLAWFQLVIPVAEKVVFHLHGLKALDLPALTVAMSLDLKR